MKTIILDKDETEIVHAYQRGTLTRSKSHASDIALLRRAARATLQKNRRINIRLTEADLIGIQTRAVEEGLPYQTLISSILHKYVTGSLLDRKSA